MPSGHRALLLCNAVPYLQVQQMNIKFEQEEREKTPESNAFVTLCPKRDMAKDIIAKIEFMLSSRMSMDSRPWGKL